MSENTGSRSDREMCPPITLRDRSSTTSILSEQQIKMCHSKRIRRNPFSERQRLNFPDFNDVFKSTKEPSSRLIYGDNRIHDQHENIFHDEDDEGDWCEQPDIDVTSELNMSIGARAALNEHARYVAKYGIDGEMDVKIGIKDENIMNDGENSTIRNNSLLDHQWERLLNLSRVASSVGGSVSEGIPSPISTTIDLHLDNSSAERSKSEELSFIEVMTDVSHDFFNSSRVNLLITPERNKNTRTEIVMTNAHDEGDDGLLKLLCSKSEDRQCHKENKNQAAFIEFERSQQHGKANSDLEGLLFNMGDISRISNKTASDTNNTSDLSFDIQNRDKIYFDNDKTNDDGNCYVYTTMFENSPSSILNESSPSSVQESRTQGRLTSVNSNAQEFLPDPGSSEEVAFSRNWIASAGFESPEISTNSSSIQSAVSSFLAEACTFARKIVDDVEKSIAGIESLPVDFLRGTDADQTNTPNSMCQVSTSHQDRQELGKNLNNNVYRSSRVDLNTFDTSSSSFPSSTVGDTIQNTLTGRKRYRTVVPRRAYLELSTQQIDEEQDSFIAVQSNPEIRRTNASLLESFDEAKTCRTF